MKRALFAGIAVLGLAAAGVAVLLTPENASRERLPDTGTLTTTSPSPHPLSRDAIAARPYPGGPIKVEQTLGDRGGFQSFIVSYPSDGLKINSLMNVPNGPRPAAGWPVVIFNHGYFPPKEYRTDSADYRTWSDGLARAGYLVLKPDYRGHAQSEGTGTGGNWSPDYTYDVLNLIGSVKQFPQADARRIGMFGHSMGGGITMRAISASTEIKAAAVIGGVVGSAEDLLYGWRRTPMPTTTANPARFGSQRQKLIDEYGEFNKNPDFWNSVSPQSGISHIVAPVQIHHGTADAVVPKQFSDSLNGALVGAGKPAEYFQYPGGDHYFTGNGDVVLQRMIGLFNRNVKGAP